MEGRDEDYRVKVRNLSAGGMMAEGEAKVMRGALVAVELRNIGWVEGSVAWKQDNRFGIAFVEALYAGLPVVTTALGEDGKVGGHVAVGDAEFGEFFVGGFDEFGGKGGAEFAGEVRQFKGREGVRGPR